MTVAQIRMITALILMNVTLIRMTIALIRKNVAIILMTVTLIRMTVSLIRMTVALIRMILELIRISVTPIHTQKQHTGNTERGRQQRNEKGVKIEKLKIGTNKCLKQTFYFLFYVLPCP